MTQPSSPIHPLAQPPMQDAEGSASSAPPKLDIIFINGFVGETLIGIHHDEMHDTQPVRVDLEAGLPRSLACDTDRIGDTIDYSEVRSALREMLQTHRFRLLEAFAEAVANLLLNRFGAHWVRVSVTKPHKFDDVEGVGVIIERSRQARSRRESGQAAEVLSLLGAGMVPDSPPR